MAIIYGYTNAEVVQVLIDTDQYALDYNESSPEDWLAAVTCDNDLHPWARFCESHSLEDFNNFDDLRDAWEDFRDHNVEELWDHPTIEDTLCNEVDNVFQSMADNADTEQKFRIIQEAC